MRMAEGMNTPRRRTETEMREVQRNAAVAALQQKREILAQEATSPSPSKQAHAAEGRVHVDETLRLLEDEAGLGDAIRGVTALFEARRVEPDEYTRAALADIHNTVLDRSLRLKILDQLTKHLQEQFPEMFKK